MGVWDPSFTLFGATESGSDVELRSRQIRRVMIGVGMGDAVFLAEPIEQLVTFVVSAGFVAGCTVLVKVVTEGIKFFKWAKKLWQGRNKSVAPPGVL